jgi:hypothetical protein
LTAFQLVLHSFFMLTACHSLARVDFSAIPTPDLGIPAVFRKFREDAMQPDASGTF